MHQIASHDVYFLKLFWGSMPPDPPRRHVQNGLTNQNWLAPGLMGTNLPNHSYVNLTLVGNIREGNDSVQCHSDLDTCCGGSGYPDRGDWYFPNGMRLNFNSGTADLYQFHTTHRVDLRCKNSDTSGIYRCTVETNTVHSDDDSDTTARETVYVGLYSSGGKC